MSGLPIDEVVPTLLSQMASHARCVLQAPPGAGKSTRVPLALLDAPFLQDQKILLLEPRRLAARAVAARMAESLGEPLGQTVGYRMRMDTRVSAATRLEVVTDGILTRWLQRDPELSGVGAVLFDEFHERSLQNDLGLALCLDVQQGLREDLKLLLMSATLDGPALAERLSAPLVVSQGRQYPVEIAHVLLDQQRPLEQAVVQALGPIVAETEGDILLFSPGMASIRKLQRAAQQIEAWSDVDCLPLHGSLSEAEQRRALAPAAPGRRKLVFSSAIAETSITLPGVTTVVDMGLDRRARYAPSAGMTKLHTVRASQASAEQRTGRAGRVGPGRGYRLWPASEQRAKQSPVEIQEADLSALLLELRQWGVQSLDEVFWLDAPPSAHVSAAESLLQSLHALDAQGRITAHGQQLAQIGAHPRLAHMLVRAAEWGQLPVAAALAALLQEGDALVRSCQGDLGEALAIVRGERPAMPQQRALVKTLHRSAKPFQQRVSKRAESTAQNVSPGAVLALAFPDRVAQRRGPRSSRYKLSNGKGAAWRDQAHALAHEPYLVACDLDAQGREAWIRAAIPVHEHELRSVFDEALVARQSMAFDPQTQAVQSLERVYWGELILSEKPASEVDAEAVLEHLLRALAEQGLSCLPWDEASEQLRCRVSWWRRLFPELASEWPQWSDEDLLAQLDQWLAPFCAGFSRFSHVQKLDLHSVLLSQLSYAQQQQLEAALPSHWTVPSGSRLRLEYLEEEVVLAVRLQEMYGCQSHPSVAEGRLPLTLHLLSPAQRVTQITRDLPKFWGGSYRAVAKDLKGRYPKHYWPDDPSRAQALRGTKKQLRSQ